VGRRRRHERAFVQRLAEAFFDPVQIGAWIRDGATATALVGEIGALLSSADLSAAVKAQLDDVRAFLSHHDLLGDPSRWPVPQAEPVVAQLASQEPDATFARVEAGAVDTVKEKLLIKWKDKPQARRQCRRTYKTGGGVSAVAVCRDGSRLAYAAGGQVVVRDFRTGFVVSQMRGHTDRVWSVCFSPDGTKIVSGSWDKTVLIWDAASGEQLCSLNVDGQVFSVDWSPCGSKMAATCNVFNGGSWHGSVKIFTTEGSAGTFVCQSTLRVDRAVLCLRYAPNGDMLALGDEGGNINFFNSQGEKLQSPVSVDAGMAAGQ
jgi:hypothetical protein